MNTELDNVEVGVINQNSESSFEHIRADNMSNPQQTRSPSGSDRQGDSPLLIRSRRRVIGNTSTRTVAGLVKRNYAVAPGVMFTNFLELKNDMVAPDCAQEMVEEMMSIVGIDMSNHNATKMFEDVLFTFYIENGASSRTGYEKVVDIYDVEFDLMVVLNVLVSHSVTPRRFTRGLADRIFVFLRQPENQPLRADVIRRYNLTDPDDACIAFDGSTHVSNMTNDRLQAAHMLASRGIYENTASVKNATDRSTYDGMLSQQQMKSGALHLGGPQS